ncbi:MAG: DUF3788 domain-containing protein [Bacteroidetes bacterium]|nr:DUF3788 domain-containing protein [Bacteroidota bacterium]
MDDHSVFMDKQIIPTNEDLLTNLGATYKFWTQLKEYIFEQYPDGKEDWNFPGKKYGWSFRIKDKKRAIMYFLPREGYFKVAFVFGQKALDIILETDVDQNIKDNLLAAKKYAEGRGISIEVRDQSNISDIKKLVNIKLAN